MSATSFLLRLLVLGHLNIEIRSIHTVGSFIRIPIRRQLWLNVSTYCVSGIVLTKLSRRFSRRLSARANPFSTRYLPRSTLVPDDGSSKRSVTAGTLPSCKYMRAQCEPCLCETNLVLVVHVDLSAGVGDTLELGVRELRVVLHVGHL